MAATSRKPVDDPTTIINNMTVKQLNDYLHARSISTTGKRRAELLTLALNADSMKLPTKKNEDERQFDDQQTNVDRRTIDNVVLPSPGDPRLKFNKDLTNIPAITYSDLYDYLVNENEASKALAMGIGLMRDGHVDDVQMCEIPTSQACYIKAKCIPAEKLSAQPYSVWVLVRTADSSVYSAECTCVTGDGACKHIAALLFSIEWYVKEYRGPTCTDKPCQWVRPSGKNMEPMLAAKVKVAKAEHGKVYVQKEDPHWTTHIPVETVHSNDFLQKVKKELLKKNPGAVVLKSLVADSELKVIPKSMHELAVTFRATPASNENSETFLQYLQRVIDKKHIAEVAAATKGQANNNLWHQFRTGRITASICHTILHLKETTSPSRLLKTILGKDDQLNVAPVIYGQRHEPVARKLYVNTEEKNHKGFRFEVPGLQIMPTSPFLGASPDGVVSCKCCDERIVEIKCPYSKRLTNPADACQDSQFHCRLENGNIVLKPTSPWYTQIQVQLAVTGKKSCDFVLFCGKTIAIQTIPFDSALWDLEYPKLESFYCKHVVSQL